MSSKQIVQIMIVTLLLVVAALPVQAESLSQRYQTFLTSELYKMLIESKWDQQARLICGDSAGRSGLGLGQLVELKQVLGSGEVPDTGAWIHRVPGNTCGKRRTFNILVEFGPEGPLAITLLPGDTQAGPLLQKDALDAASSAALLKVKTCELPIVVDTIQGGPIPGVPGGWIEHWYFDACGQVAVASMMFAPDGAGGTSFQAR